MVVRISGRVGNVSSSKGLCVRLGDGGLIIYGCFVLSIRWAWIIIHLAWWLCKDVGYEEGFSISQRKISIKRVRFVSSNFKNINFSFNERIWRYRHQLITSKNCLGPLIRNYSQVSFVSFIQKKLMYRDYLQRMQLRKQNSLPWKLWCCILMRNQLEAWRVAV